VAGEPARGESAGAVERADCDSLNRVNSVLLASSFRARAAAESKVKADGLESLLAGGAGFGTEKLFALSDPPELNTLLESAV
jgi:hypothetical protein